MLFTATTTEPKQRKLQSFDPRNTADREPDIASNKEAIKQLTELCPHTCIRHLWGVSPQPPDFLTEVTVETSPDLQTILSSLLLQRHCTTQEQLELQLDHSVIEFIEAATTQQANSSLWQDLHKGRITSSLFGSVLRAKNSPSLVNRILDNRYEKTISMHIIYRVAEWIQSFQFFLHQQYPGIEYPRQHRH